MNAKTQVFLYFFLAQYLSDSGLGSIDSEHRCLMPALYSSSPSAGQQKVYKITVFLLVFLRSCAARKFLDTQKRFVVRCQSMNIDVTTVVTNSKRFRS